MAEINSLDAPVSDDGLAVLERAGVLTPEARQSVKAWRLTPDNLARDAGRLLLIVGSSFAVIGVVLFFGLNWDAMGAILQLAVPQALIFGCLYIAWKTGAGSLPGKICVLAASVFAGIWLAIFGVLFPSGKDVFFLFVAWAVLISPWVLAMRFAPLWLLWLGILNAALGRFFSLDFGWHHYWWWNDDDILPWLSIAALNAFALLLRERNCARNAPWLAVRWVRPVLLTSVLFCLSFALIITLFKTSLLVIGIIVHTVAVIFLLRIYRRRIPDFLSVSLTVLDASIMLVVLMVRGLIAVVESQHWQDILAFIVCLGVAGVFTIGIFAGAAFWLKRIHAEMRQAQAQTPVEEHASERSEVDVPADA